MRMRNIVLIGMPGAGKSTLGIQLAKALGLGFIDTDVLIQQAEKKLLHEILDATDYLNLRRLEEEVLLSLDCENHLIATGGSAIYSNNGMNKLKSLGQIIFLDLPMRDLLKRIGDYSQRGIASDKEQNFADIYAERIPLYRKYAEKTIDCTNKSQEELLQELVGLA